MFTQESIQRVREAVDIVDLVGEDVRLKRAGREYKACCPFHNEKTPSFYVVPEKQIYHCFGCGKGGTAFDWMREYHGMSFPDAVQALADRSGVRVERDGDYDPEAAREAADRKSIIQKLNSRAVAWYEEQLFTPGGRKALEYLLDRGFTEETVREWRLGWAPGGFDNLRNRLADDAREHWPDQEPLAVEAGLLRRSEDGGNVYDFFRGRVMFPIFDPHGKPLGFGGRILEEDPDRPAPKYLNTSDSPVFDKRRVLYGMHAAAREARRSREIVVVEGYTDVIMCHQHGIRNVAATLGTSLTPEHVTLMKRYADTAVARFDADEAGARATERSVRIFVEADMPLRVIRSLEIKDACEYLPVHGAEGFRAELERAEDAYAFWMRICLEDRNLRNVDEKAEAVREIMEVVNLSPDAMKREMLRKQVSELTGVPVETLPRPQRRRPRRSEERDERPFDDADAPPVEDDVADRDRVGARDLLQPDLVAELEFLHYMEADRKWYDFVYMNCRPEDEFSTDLYREAAALLHEGWEETRDELRVADLLTRTEDQGISQLLAAIAMRNQNDPDLLSDEKLLETWRYYKERRLREERDRIQDELRHAAAAGDAEQVEALCEMLTRLFREITEMEEQQSDGSAA